MAPQLLLLGLLLSFLMFTDAQSVGVCNGRVGNNLPRELDTVNLFRRNGITRMRIYDPNPNTLRALNNDPGTNIELMLDVPNSDLQRLNDPPAARAWVQNNILNYRNVRFRYIVVGNEVDPNNNFTKAYVNFVLPAMRNIHRAIADAGLGNRIRVSTATYTGLLRVSYPPSDGVFHDNVSRFMGPIISFLDQNNLPMLANIYPYFAVTGNPRDVNLQYALFAPNAPRVNDSGVIYNNLFDAMLDAHYAAQRRLGGGRLNIVVSESGWPSSGDRFATVENAGTYYRNLITRVKRGNGTPARPQAGSIETYLFAMFDENMKPGLVTERFFGVFLPNQQSKYNLSF